MGEELVLMQMVDEDPALAALAVGVMGAFVIGGALIFFFDWLERRQTAKVLDQKLTNKSRQFEFGDIVYHVANPTVAGIVTSIEYDERNYIPTVDVVFDEPVSFSMASYTARHWICSHNLLYRTSEEAQANNNPELRDPWKYTKFVTEQWAKERTK